MRNPYTGPKPRATNDVFVDEYLTCHRVCIEAARYSLSLGGKYATPGHIHLLYDCAQLCATVADLILRGSDFQTQARDLCAEVSAACADSCQNLGPHDATLYRCAEACRRCTEFAVAA